MNEINREDVRKQVVNIAGGFKGSCSTLYGKR